MCVMAPRLGKSFFHGVCKCGQLAVMCAASDCGITWPRALMGNRGSRPDSLRAGVAMPRWTTDRLFSIARIDRHCHQRVFTLASLPDLPVSAFRPPPGIMR